MSAPDFETVYTPPARERIDVCTGGRSVVSATVVEAGQWDLFASVADGLRFPRKLVVPSDKVGTELAARVIAAGLFALGYAEPGPTTHRVKFVVEVVMCDACDTYFGIPKSFDGKPFHCPNGHPNEGHEFDKEKA